MRFVGSRLRSRVTGYVPIACAMLGTGCGDGSESAAPPRAGEIQVSVSMTGADVPATYSVLVGGRTVSGSASLGATVGGLLPGEYSLMLRVPRNCEVAGNNPRAVTVAAGQTTELAFSITCVASTGTLRVTTVTTGVDLDPDGYQLHVAGYNLDGKRYLKDWAIGANETQILSAMSIGQSDVTLTGFSINCDPANEMRRSVAVAPPETVTVTFTLACTPATGQLAYVVGMAPGIRHIYLITVTGRRVGRLTADETSDEDPAWSPDGKKLAFTTDRNGNQEIYVADADGLTAVRLTNDPAADYQPAWSPDGTRIAFVSKRAGAADIFTMNVDGTNVTRLTTTPGVDTDPAWSRDGRIAFTSDRDGPSDIYVMNADGSEARRLTTAGGAHPAWSPDGARLAYSSSYCPFAYCAPSIYIKSGSEDAPANFGPGERPAWSPDGRKIAFNGHDCDFYYISCTPSSIRLARLGLTDVIDVASGFNPAWRP